MSTAFSKLLEQNGVPISPDWTLEFGLKRCDALTALNLLREEGQAVLGGDVFHLIGAAIEPAYANWYCDRTENEPNQHYMDRSIEVALDYIARYPDTDSHVTPLFVLVVSEGE